MAVRDQALTSSLPGMRPPGPPWRGPALLGRHELDQPRVRDEVVRVAGERSIVDTDVDQLRHTDQVVNEALALYPCGHTIVRRAREATTVSGHEVRPGGLWRSV
ncbi:MAG: cytochrome P450 [Acidimicrobiales bacterium]